MKKLNNYRFILLLGILLLASCTDERYEVNESLPTGKTVEVPLTFTVDKMLNADGGLTRTVPGDLDGNDGAGAEVKKMTIFQFNELDFFIRKSDATIENGVISVALTEGTGVNKLIVLANAPVKFGVTLTGKYNDVLKQTVELAEESDFYYTENGESYLFMSGYTTIDFSSGTPGELDVTFKRNVAKVILELKLNDGIELKSVRLRNIPKQMLLADQVSEQENLVPYDNSTGESVFPFNGPLLDYDIIENVSGYLKNGKYTFAWYVPRNEQGTITNTDSKQKTIDKKPNATYYEFVVQDATGYQAVFSIVPGANNTTDYNLIPNKVYTTSLTIAGLGEGDDRINNVTTFEGFSNCYILNPPSAGKRTYVIPIKQVYKYWKGTSAGYGNEVSKVSSGTWTVSHLWSDVTASGVSISTSNGSFNSTEEEGAFEVKVESNATNGNYIVALKNSSGTILWSWHLWVTDYNPDAFTGPIETNKYKYAVNGGYVDRYGDVGWTTGTFKNSVMMDRNLGALEERPEYVAGSFGQLYYQYGRKDPFLETNSSLKTGISISSSVQEPRTFYTVSSESSWTSDDVLKSTYNWFDSEAAVTEGVKSIYDPCPEGWMVPRGLLANLHTDFVGDKYKRIQDGEDNDWDKIRGIEYRPNSNDNEIIWYPAAGYLNTAGSFSKAWSPGTYWTSDYYSGNKSYRYNLGPTKMTDNDTACVAFGEPVRCVKKDAVN